MEAGLHAGALLLAALLRWAMLDARPLSGDEAALAMESFGIWYGSPPAGPHENPLSLMGVALAIGLFGAGDGQVRLLSAVFGTALVAAPFLLRTAIGRVPAVIAAYGLALSPLLLYASRSVTSGVTALALGALLWWLVREGVRTLNRAWAYGAAIVAGSLIASGRDGITVLGTLILAALLSSPAPSTAIQELRKAGAFTAWRRLAVVLLASAAAIGSGLGTHPLGIQWALVDVWRGWLGSFSLAAPRAELLLLLGLYELPVVLLGGVQLLRSISSRNGIDVFLSIWAMSLLLLVMTQDVPYTSRLILPLFPIYLLASRLAGRAIGVIQERSGGWRWNLAAVALATPLAVGTVLLNRASTPNTMVPAPYLYAEVALVGVACLSLFALLGERARASLVASCLAVLAAGYLLHGTVLTNYVQSGAEPITGVQPSHALRQAATEASYYSRYFGAGLTIDPALRPAVEWYVRDARAVEWSAEAGEGMMIAMTQAGSQVTARDQERRPGVYSPSLDAGRFRWQELWRWMLDRSGLVARNQRDIIVRAPASGW